MTMFPDLIYFPLHSRATSNGLRWFFCFSRLPGALVRVPCLLCASRRKWRPRGTCCRAMVVLIHGHVHMYTYIRKQPSHGPARERFIPLRCGAVRCQEDCGHGWERISARASAWWDSDRLEGDALARYCRGFPVHHHDDSYGCAHDFTHGLTFHHAELASYGPAFPVALLPAHDDPKQPFFHKPKLLAHGSAFPVALLPAAHDDAKQPFFHKPKLLAHAPPVSISLLSPHDDAKQPSYHTPKLLAHAPPISISLLSPHDDAKQPSYRLVRCFLPSTHPPS